jgi:hypothetical protein
MKKIINKLKKKNLRKKKKELVEQFQQIELQIQRLVTAREQVRGQIALIEELDSGKKGGE